MDRNTMAFNGKRLYGSKTDIDKARKEIDSQYEMGLIGVREYNKQLSDLEALYRTHPELFKNSKNNTYGEPFNPGDIVMCVQSSGKVKYGDKGRVESVSGNEDNNAVMVTWRGNDENSAPFKVSIPRKCVVAI